MNCNSSSTNIYTFFANSYIECITDISSRSTSHCLRRHSILLASILSASISVTFKPLIRPVISTIHICSQIVATHKLDVNRPIMCSLSKPDLVIILALSMIQGTIVLIFNCSFLSFFVFFIFSNSCKSLLLFFSEPTLFALTFSSAFLCL